MTTSKRIKVNKARCRKCDEIVISAHRHDYQRCSCGRIAVDGGREYLKRAFIDQRDIEELTEYFE